MCPGWEERVVMGNAGPRWPLAPGQALEEEAERSQAPRRPAPGGFSLLAEPGVAPSFSASLWLVLVTAQLFQAASHRSTPSPAYLSTLWLGCIRATPIASDSSHAPLCLLASAMQLPPILVFNLANCSQFWGLSLTWNSQWGSPLPGAHIAPDTFPPQPFAQGDIAECVSCFTGLFFPDTPEATWAQAPCPPGSLHA